MKAEILHSFLDAIVMDHQRYGTESLMEQAVGLIQADVNNNRSATSAKELLHDLKFNLRMIASETFFDPGIAELDLKENFLYLGSQLADKIANIQVDSNENGYLLQKNLENLKYKHSNSLNSLRNATSTLRSLGIGQFDFDHSDQHMIIVSFPINANSDLSIAANYLNSVESLFGAVHRALKQDASPIAASALSTSRLKAYIHQNSVVAAALSAIITFNLESYKAVLDIQSQKQHLAKAQVSIAHELDIENLKSQISESCATRVGEQFDDLAIDYDELQLKAACKQSLSLIYQGFDFSVYPSRPSNNEGTELGEIVNFVNSNAIEIYSLSENIKESREPTILLSEHSAEQNP